MTRFTISSQGGDAGPHHEIIMKMQGKEDYYPNDRQKHGCTVHIEKNLFSKDVGYYYCDIRSGSTYKLIDPDTMVVPNFDSLSLGVLEQDDSSENDSTQISLPASQWYEPTCEPYVMLVSAEFDAETSNKRCISIGLEAGAEGGGGTATGTQGTESCSEWVDPAKSYIFHLEITPFDEDLPRRAIMDLGASFDSSSAWDGNWKNPRLDSATGFHNAKDQGNFPQWWEVNMPEQEYYTVSDMTLKKRGDTCCSERTINFVKLQYSVDNGNTWNDHDNGRLFKTGSLTTDELHKERKFQIDPPMNGNAFRVLIDPANKSGDHMQGRFDLWAVKNPNFIPEIDSNPGQKRAIMDLGASFDSSSAWDKNWKNPRLDSASGFHNAKNEGNLPQWWQVNMPGQESYTVNEMSLKKRGDTCCSERTIHQVQFQYSEDNGTTWIDHENGKLFQTGSLEKDSNQKERKFMIDPPMKGNAFRVLIDPANKSGDHMQGRFDFWVVKDVEKQ